MNAVQDPSQLTLETSEGVLFRIPLASPFIRGIAWAVDMLFMMVISKLLEPLLLGLSAIHPDWISGLSIVIFFVVQILYAVLFEGFWSGRTPGKALLGLQVVDAQGLALTLKQVWIRNLLRFVDLIPVCYLLGGIVSLCSPHYQRIGDWAANTVVMRRRKSNPFSIQSIESTRFNSMERHPQVIARLRQELSPDEVALAFEALLRRDTLNPEARIQVFEKIVENWKSRIRFPEEDLHGISPENRVRNTLELLLKGRKS